MPGSQTGSSRSSRPTPQNASNRHPPPTGWPRGRSGSPSVECASSRPTRGTLRGLYAQDVPPPSSPGNPSTRSSNVLMWSGPTSPKSSTASSPPRIRSMSARSLRRLSAGQRLEDVSSRTTLAPFHRVHQFDDPGVEGSLDAVLSAPLDNAAVDDVDLGLRAPL